MCRCHGYPLIVVFSRAVPSCAFSCALAMAALSSVPPTPPPPPQPTLDIGEGGLDTLIALYKATLPSLGGYLTNAGRLNRGRLEALLRNFGEKEREILEQR